MSIIPNFVTAANMFFGFAAMIYTMQGEYTTAIWGIFFASLLDLLDGRIARTLNATSKFGVEFDSFSDLVSFGVAPSLLLYQVFFIDWGFGGMVLSFAPMLFGAIRLARYNTEAGRGNPNFSKGLAIPAAALLLAGYVGFANEFKLQSADMIAASVVVAISFLMVSNIPFHSNKMEGKRSQNWKVFPFISMLISVAIWGVVSIFFWSALYTLLGLTRWLALTINEHVFNGRFA